MPVTANHDFLWLDVAMHDAGGRASSNAPVTWIAISQNFDSSIGGPESRFLKVTPSMIRGNIVTTRFIPIS